jgi:diguanylate cyclase (GGDEF)-like protein/PAS domain S-box-containing protein
VPVHSGENKIIGTFALSSFEHRSPSLFHRKLLEIGSSIIGIVLERSKSQESLRLFKKVYEGSEEGIIVTDTNKLILLVNNSFTRITGYTIGELRGKTPQFFASGKHDARFYAGMWESIQVFGHWRGEIWNRRKNGEIFPEWLGISAVKDQTGKITHYVGIFTDISDKKHAEQQIEHLSSHDALTGLPHLILFRDRVENTIALTAGSNTKIALINLDFDNFKLLNESFGHAVGDELLLGAAMLLKSCLRETDSICRRGGDEFIITLANITDTETISTIVDNILKKTSVPSHIGDHTVSLPCSIGIAVYPEDGDEFEDLINKSSKAMLKAKDDGGNTYRYFTEQLNSDSLEYLRIAQALRDAIALNQFELHYQPQIEMNTGRVIGAEALIRWNHPDTGQIQPGQFISIAEQTGLIVKIGEWVLHEACRQAMVWQKAGLPAITMAVNVSAVQFRRDDMEKSVRSELERSGLLPQYLELELTESVLLHNMDQMQLILTKLKNFGVKIAIDDFGTGYSSLAYLKKFNIDRLKIDQSFVRDIATDTNVSAIIRAIVQMAHTLNLRAIAEGVEDPEMLRHLRDCLCDEVQGYYLARPMPAEKFAEYLMQMSAHGAPMDHRL